MVTIGRTVVSVSCFGCLRCRWVTYATRTGRSDTLPAKLPIQSQVRLATQRKSGKIGDMNPLKTTFPETPIGSKTNSPHASLSRVLRASGQANLTKKVGRRDFLKGVGALGLAGVGAPFIVSGASKPRTPLRHIVVDMQENRSFDHYYGYAPWVGGYGVPASYAQPDGAGGFVKPYHFTSLSTPDIGHSWY